MDKITAVNKINWWLNNVVPAIIKELDKGYKVKADGQLHKKYQHKIEELMSQGAPPRTYYRLEFSKYGGAWLKTSLYYDDPKSGHYNNGYHSVDICIERYLAGCGGDTDKWTPLWVSHTPAGIRLAQGRIKALEDQIEKAQDEINEIKRKSDYIIGR